MELKPGQSIYEDAQIDQLFAELEAARQKAHDLEVKERKIIKAVKSIKNMMPFDGNGNIDMMKAMNIPNLLKNDAGLQSELSFLTEYINEHEKNTIRIIS